MPGNKIVRKRYFIHPSSQLKYIALSVLPALLMSIFCIQILVVSGELILKKEQAKLTREISQVNQRYQDTLQQFQQKNFAQEELTTVAGLLKELISIEKVSKISYSSVLRQWAELKIRMLFVIFSILLFVGVTSLIFSHRIAGPIYRLKTSIDMLSENKEIPPVHLRQYDEFKELGESLEKLRKFLKEKK
ncbi:MAG TPA: hypothetical protein P5110_04490 [Candidatus Omnitrophota bacterium]|nr:hypothetical protein [Candidatus Omnitrophota bacterium]HRZ14750.1 hypothetical protein [Candidatus Omnitrophota bacterium]